MTAASTWILVTYDGSKASKEIFAPAARLARRMQASLVLLRVYHAPKEIWVHPDAGYREAELTRLNAEWQAEIDAAAKELRRLDVPVEALARMLGKRWNIAGEILAVADEYKVEMICMATHGESGVRHFFAGSTALEVLTSSDRPVTFVRIKDEE